MLFINKILEYISIFLVLYFIYQQVKLEENYKLIIYVIRFFVFMSPIIYLQIVYDEICKLMSLTKNNMNQNLSKLKIIIIECIFLAMTGIIIDRFINPVDSVGLLKMISQDSSSILFSLGIIKSLLSYLWYYKVEILIFFILGVIMQYVDKNIFGYEKEKNDC